ncbi:DUF378 domain-containing protein [Candidatus Nomurabacteria bacterium]|nr:DUF378 domain-containing protein [Candidatus Nomurabacteria bacterium]
MCCNGKSWGGCCVHKVCKLLVFVGGLNWGLVGVGMLMGSNWNVVNMLLGSWPTVEAVVYVLVGVAAVLKLFGCKCKKCMEAHTACCSTENMNEQM